MSDDSFSELPDRALNTPPRGFSKSLDDSLGVLMLAEDGVDDDQNLIEPPSSSSPQRLLRKRSKSFSSPESLIKRQKTSTSKNQDTEPRTSGTSIQKCDKNSSDKANSSTSSTTVDVESQYSALQYIESIGILRKIMTPKHRGVSNIHGSLPSGHQDRNAKLKISYRIRLLDGDVQFVLIIYEHLVKQRNSRRNLMAEFNAMKSTSSTGDKSEGKKSQTKCIKNNFENKSSSKMSTFKRLRF